MSNSVSGFALVMLIALSSCSYLSIGSVSGNATFTITSTSLSSGKLNITGSNLNLVTSVAIEQAGIVKTLSIESKSASGLSAALAQTMSLKATLPVTLMVSTANAQTPVTLTVDLDGTTVNNLKFADQTTLGSNGLLIVADTQPDGATQMVCPQGVWNTRILNTTIENTIPNATLSTNQISLPAGTYYVEAEAPAGGSDIHQAQLYNVTTSAYVAIGTMARSTTGSGILTVSKIIGKFTLATTSLLEVRQRCQGASAFLTRTSPNWGLPALFTVVKIKSL